MDTTRTEQGGVTAEAQAQPNPETGSGKYERKLSARQEKNVAQLAERLYDFIPPVCWITEANLAAALKTTTRQIKNAKAYLAKQKRVRIEIQPNGRRMNPIHTIIKTSPIKPIYRGTVGESRLNWEVFNEISANDLNQMSLSNLFDVYEEVGLEFFPLHYPKFKPDGTPYCSCKRGRNCPFIGKHPVCPFKELDYSTYHTYRSMRDYWFYEFWSKRDSNYNVGFRTNGFLVVDVDYRSNGNESLGLLEEELGELPATLTVKTGNGRHLYLKDTYGVSSLVGLWSGIDIKTGNGSFVVAPFSLHKSQRDYVWETVGVPEALPETWSYAITDGKPASVKTNRGRGGNYSDIRRKIALPRFLTPDYVIHNHSRNDTLFAFASRERGRGGDYPRVLDAITELNAKYCREPLTTTELEGIAASACRYETNAEKLMRHAA
jgi:hypothetical protein